MGATFTGVTGAGNDGEIGGAGPAALNLSFPPFALAGDFIVLIAAGRASPGGIITPPPLFEEAVVEVQADTAAEQHLQIWYKWGADANDVLNGVTVDYSEEFTATSTRAYSAMILTYWNVTAVHGWTSLKRAPGALPAGTTFPLIPQPLGEGVHVAAGVVQASSPIYQPFDFTERDERSPQGNHTLTSFDAIYGFTIPDPPKFPTGYTGARIAASITFTGEDLAEPRDLPHLGLVRGMGRGVTA